MINHQKVGIAFSSNVKNHKSLRGCGLTTRSHAIGEDVGLRAGSMYFPKTRL